MDTRTYRMTSFIQPFQKNVLLPRPKITVYPLKSMQYNRQTIFTKKFI